MNHMLIHTASSRMEAQRKISLKVVYQIAVQITTCTLDLSWTEKYAFRQELLKKTAIYAVMLSGKKLNTALKSNFVVVHRRPPVTSLKNADLRIMAAVAQVQNISKLNTYHKFARMMNSGLYIWIWIHFSYIKASTSQGSFKGIPVCIWQIS